MKQSLITIIILLFATTSYCCSCIGQATVRQELNHSDIVFTGKVLSHRILELTDTLMPSIRIQKAEYLVSVTRIYKGKIRDNKLKVVTGLGGGDCGFEFKLGKEYIIYSSLENKYYPQGNTVNDFLYTDICRRTRLATDKKEINALNKRCKERRKKQVNN